LLLVLHNDIPLVLQNFYQASIATGITIMHPAEQLNNKNNHFSYLFIKHKTVTHEMIYVLQLPTCECCQYLYYKSTS